MEVVDIDPEEDDGNVVVTTEDLNLKARIRRLGKVVRTIEHSEEITVTHRISFSRTTFADPRPKESQEETRTIRSHSTGCRAS